MRIAICDDNIQELASISNIIGLFKTEHCPSLTYEVFNCPNSLLSKVRKQEFDLLLLDIIMPEMSGLDLASIIRTFDMEIPIIFLTSSPEFAISSYRVHAKDYLLKPVDKTLLFDALLTLTKANEQFLVVKTIDSVMQLPFSQIVYFEVVARKLCIYLEDGTMIQTTGTLSEYEERLIPYPQFYKPHRSYLINLQHVTKLDKDGIHTNLCNVIPVPKPTFAKTKNAYMNYLIT